MPRLRIAWAVTMFLLGIAWLASALVIATSGCDYSLTITAAMATIGYLSLSIGASVLVGAFLGACANRNGGY